jgi:DNA repair exonuclease SbcCD nuclease subunit
MIVISGDTHGEVDYANIKNGRIKSLCGDEWPTHVIVAGDFGFIWQPGKEENYWRKILKAKPFRILAVKGNHENHERLNSDEFPLVDLYGGKARQIEENVFVLEHGNVYTIEDKTFFVMGGAMSIDKVYRINRKTWWEEEIPSYADFYRGKEALEKIGNKVNYIITHTIPGIIYDEFFTTDFLEKRNDPLYKMLNYFWENIQFDHWVAGHFHIDRQIELNDKKLTILFNKGKILETGVSGK